MGITLTEEQSLAVASMYNHITIYTALRQSGIASHDYLKKNQCFVLTGYAGTGKSAVIVALWDALRASSAPTSLVGTNLTGVITAFTGRACENLEEKGIPCNTSHSLFYEAVLDEKGNLAYFRIKSPQDIIDSCGDFVIVEEASMMNMDTIQKVIDSGVAVIFVGDDAQLPPIDGPNIFDRILKSNETGKGDFTKTPMIMFEDIKRTKEGSSINIFADHIRRTGYFDKSLAGNDVSFITKSTINVRWLKTNWENWDVILCGTNRTRKKMNRFVRAACGYNDELPEVGERILCLKNTVIDTARINNGELYTVVSVFAGQKISTFQIKKVSADGKPIGNLMTVKVDNNMWDEETRLDENFNNKTLHDFTFGYAMTVHKMQGSSAANVIFLDEDVSFFLDQQRFRYTGVTRTSNRLLVGT